MSSNKRVIINADDFGLSRGVTDGIIDCHVDGIITSTTLMVNMPAAEYACKLSGKYPDLGIGVHLTLTQGRSVLSKDEIPDLVDDDNIFHPHVEQAKNLWSGRVIEDQVRREFSAQIEKCRSMGVNPTHCDSHHGIHRMPVAMRALVAAVSLLDVPRARNQLGYSWTGEQASLSDKLRCRLSNLKRAHRIAGHRYNRYLANRGDVIIPDRKVVPLMRVGSPPDFEESLASAFMHMPNGVSELVMHPAREDEQTNDSVNFARVRQRDTRALTSRDVIDAVAESGVELINFSHLNRV